MNDLTCIICGNNDFVAEVYPQTFSADKLTPAIFSARRVTEHWHYRMLRCRGCSLLFSSPVLSREKLAELYGGSSLTYEKEINNITESYASGLKPYLALIPDKKRALEIGCGNGFFLNWLKGAGFSDLTGFEPSAQAVSCAPEEIRGCIRQCFFENDTGLHDNTMDLICSFQTLDHLLTPLATITRCRELLCKGGIAFFVTHDERALQARILGEKSPIYDIEHIYLFNKKTLTALFKKSGFEVVAVFNIRNRYSLYYWVNMTPLPFKKLVLKLLIRMGLKEIPVALHAGNIGIIARKPQT